MAIKAPKTPFEIAAALRDSARAGGLKNVPSVKQMRAKGVYASPAADRKTGRMVTGPAGYVQSMISGIQPATRGAVPSGPSVGPFTYRGWSSGVDND